MVLAVGIQGVSEEHPGSHRVLPGVQEEALGVTVLRVQIQGQVYEWTGGRGEGGSSSMQGLPGCRALVAMWSVVRVSGWVPCVMIGSQRRNTGGQHRGCHTESPPPHRWG